ncbi:hypothetical protein H920_15371 [Fukomys damarensis]|uniref:Uncharacterized protein n=1 Tax=Fukomys damarensis TaxID=885580 RepID=A0A091DKB3_FUKDA|nr:hypothetical protein H920_15371 [Fukomys damarensis]
MKARMAAETPGLCRTLRCALQTRSLAGQPELPGEDVCEDYETRLHRGHGRSAEHCRSPALTESEATSRKQNPLGWSCLRPLRVERAPVLLALGSSSARLVTEEATGAARPTQLAVTIPGPVAEEWRVRSSGPIGFRS